MHIFGEGIFNCTPHKHTCMYPGAFLSFIQIHAFKLVQKHTHTYTYTHTHSAQAHSHTATYIQTQHTHACMQACNTYALFLSLLIHPAQIHACTMHAIQTSPASTTQPHTHKHTQCQINVTRLVRAWKKMKKRRRKRRSGWGWGGVKQVIHGEHHLHHRGAGSELQSGADTLLKSSFQLTYQFTAGAVCCVSWLVSR